MALIAHVHVPDLDIWLQFWWNIKGEIQSSFKCLNFFTILLQASHKLATSKPQVSHKHATRQPMSLPQACNKLLPASLLPANQ